MDSHHLSVWTLLVITLVCVLQSIQKVGVAVGLNCSEGSYSEAHNSCRECGVCPEKELLTEPCTATRNSICHCKPGHFRLYPTWSYLRITCAKCRSCGNRPVVANCSESQNTQCGNCPRNYFIYNATLCAPCTICIKGDPFAIRLKRCQESGLPPWHQCSPKVVTSTDVFVFNASIPSRATQATFVTSSTHSVNGGGVQDTSQGIIIAGWITISFTGLMVLVFMFTCVGCAITVSRSRHAHCPHWCWKQRHGQKEMCCCPVSSAQRSRTFSGTWTPAAQSDAEALVDADDVDGDPIMLTSLPTTTISDQQQPLCV